MCVCVCVCVCVCIYLTCMERQGEELQSGSRGEQEGDKETRYDTVNTGLRGESRFGTHKSRTKSIHSDTLSQVTPTGCGLVLVKCLNGLHVKR